MILTHHTSVHNICTFKGHSVALMFVRVFLRKIPGLLASTFPSATGFDKSLICTAEIELAGARARFCKKGVLVRVGKST